MSKFKYRERSEETVKSRANQAGGDYDNFLAGPILKLDEGETTLRILPPTWEIKKWGDNWAIDVYIHRDIGPDKNTYLCLAKMKGEECPLCEARREFEDDEDMLKALKPQRQILAYVVDRDDEKAGPQIWRLPMSVEKEIQLRSQDKKTGAILAIDHPDNGFDITLRRTGQGLKTKYSGVDVERDETPLSEKETRQEAWLEYIQDHPLPDCLQYFEADYLEKVFKGKAAKKTDKEEDEDEKPTRAQRVARGDIEEEDRPKRKAVKEEEPEEDEKPRRVRSTKIEEEDEKPRRRRQEEEEPEEEEKPRRQHRSKSEDEDEIPTEGKRRAQEKDDDKKTSPVDRAKESLKRLRPKDDDD